MKNISLLISIIGFALIAGCSSDDSSEGGIQPTADFSFVNDGSTFTFTNLSEGGTNYRWDFGDLAFTSDEKDPVYTYDIGGELTVSLTVTNESGGEDFVSKTIEAPRIIIIDIAIDGDFEDWVDVEVTAENESGSGSMQLIKIWTGGENVNVYLEGNSNMKMELIDMFINTDGDGTTGFLHGEWPDDSGAEFLFEGPMVNNSWGSFYDHADPAGGWAWNAIAGSAANIDISAVTSLSADRNAIEFSIPKVALGELGESIGFAFTELTAGWALVANFPETTAFVKADL